MKFDPNQPIWLQVMNDLRMSIVSGSSPPGSKLPGGRDLAITYSINPNTAARVYQELEREGLCETRRGLGTYVTEDKERIAALRQEVARQAVREFMAKMSQLGIGAQKASELLLTEEEHHA